MLDDEGYLYLTGRRHDLIITGGVNVYPAEVEAVLSGVPGVVQVAVFGLPDEQWGQKVCTAYVPHGAGVEESMREVAAAQLAPYKRPKAYFAVSELPHTTTGKLLRRAIPEQLGLARDGGARLREEGGKKR
jgi:long-chain acyl-CoA synthetase